MISKTGSPAIDGTHIGTRVIDNNLFSNCARVPVQPHPVNGNPMFVNPTSDWHLQAGSPALNSGVPVLMPAYGGGFIDVSRDRNGVVRSEKWDLGVYNQ